MGHWIPTKESFEDGRACVFKEGNNSEHRVSCAFEIEMNFSVSRGLNKWLIKPKKISHMNWRTRVHKLWPTGQSHPAICFLNKVLLEHYHVHSFMCCLWVLLQYKSRVLWLHQRSVSSTSIEHLLSCPSKNVDQSLLVGWERQRS